MSNSQPPELRIHLLGGFRLLLGDAPLTSLDTPRQHLAFLFWPDSTDTQAQTNLRQLLFTLRCSALHGPVFSK